MRELKFRAWHIDRWVYFTIGETFTDVAKAIYVNACVNGKTFYQFTGLKDKNGKDIYEGDIIDLHQTINGCNLFTIEWCKKRLGWALRYRTIMNNPRTYEYDVADVFTVEEIEIIGNIHETPELIKNQ